MTVRFVKIRFNLLYFLKERINRAHAKTTEVYCYYITGKICLKKGSKTYSQKRGRLCGSVVIRYGELFFHQTRRLFSIVFGKSRITRIHIDIKYVYKSII